MRLTLHTDYALRALLYVGMRPDALVSIRQIAEAYGVSENHMVKVVHRLGQGGFIETLRGRGGGLRLARSPTEIRIGDVIRWTEEDMALVACFQKEPTYGGCILTGACGLQALLGEALEAFMAVLDRATLAELLPTAEQPSPMAARLKLPVLRAPP
ncbi:RrF2 family transcriptional regulator [Chondromyces crocatus]|uniref:Rrf2 family transcriptional regulator n=1 Tax=Chondromyces crocatus TaxID=52 RepID=A0A0K1EDA6_CHOCO|nr:Rrf2 family transcriptional regulator [Chondromyces crocatus]AKT38662.1 Rrf2 family transcriptional regulator [Chondromyces crocatus]